jgi:hypothetical protein
VLAISMYEAPTKFQADLVKKDPTKRGRFTALTIGRLMFWSMERIELVLAATLLALEHGRRSRSGGSASDGGFVSRFISPFTTAPTSSLIAFGILALQCLVL